VIKVHVFNWITCRWVWLWRPVGVVRAMRHLAFGATIACTGITVWPPPPPVEAHSPPPPVQTIVAPPPPIGFFPPPWNIPQSPDTYAPQSYPIPLGPVLPGPGGRQTQGILNGGINIAAKSILINDDIDTPPPSAQTPCVEDTPPPKSKVSEPATIALFGTGLLLLFIWRALGKYE
jgi:hypothetical protein